MISFRQGQGTRLRWFGLLRISRGRILINLASFTARDWVPRSRYRSHHTLRLSLVSAFSIPSCLSSQIKLRIHYLSNSHTQWNLNSVLINFMVTPQPITTRAHRQKLPIQLLLFTASLYAVGVWKFILFREWCPSQDWGFFIM